MQRAAGGQWVGGEINAGDVLIFHSLTVHAAAPNLSEKLRISLDCRFQDYRRVLNPATLAFAGESGKSWEKTYASWPSDNLKYYWKGLPLNLKPSKESAGRACDECCIACAACALCQNFEPIELTG